MVKPPEVAADSVADWIPAQWTSYFVYKSAGLGKYPTWLWAERSQHDTLMFDCAKVKYILADDLEFGTGTSPKFRKRSWYDPFSLRRGFAELRQDLNE